MRKMASKTFFAVMLLIVVFLFLAVEALMVAM